MFSICETDKIDLYAPDLIWCNNSCYRLYKTKKISNYLDYTNTEINCSVIKHIDGIFSQKIFVPKDAIGFVYGKQKNNIKRIQAISHTSIITIKNDSSLFMKICGDTEKQVAEAANLLGNSLCLYRKSISPTHFISLPLVSQNLKEKFSALKINILEHYKDEGINDIIFQSPEKLHITICVLTLLDEEELAKSIQIVQEYLQSKAVYKNMKINIKGIGYMNDDPSIVDVLYAKIDPTLDFNRLQHMANYLTDRFIKEGFIERGKFGMDNDVKLHMTIMNSRFGVSKSDNHRCMDNSRKSFDARNIIKNEVNYEFGCIELTSVHVSSFKVGKHGYYLPIKVFTFASSSPI